MIVFIPALASAAKIIGGMLISYGISQTVIAGAAPVRENIAERTERNERVKYEHNIENSKSKLADHIIDVVGDRLPVRWRRELEKK